MNSTALTLKWHYDVALVATGDDCFPGYPERLPLDSRLGMLLTS